MFMDYLSFIEDHQKVMPYNKFEKVIVAAKRAKEIYEAENPETEHHQISKKFFDDRHKPEYRAILEINESKVLIESTESSN